jgi:hypothetical protein
MNTTQLRSIVPDVVKTVSAAIEVAARCSNHMPSLAMISLSSEFARVSESNR